MPFDTSLLSQYLVDPTMLGGQSEEQLKAQGFGRDGRFGGGGGPIGPPPIGRRTIYDLQPYVSQGVSGLLSNGNQTELLARNAFDSEQRQNASRTLSDSIRARNREAQAAASAQAIADARRREEHQWAIGDQTWQGTQHQLDRDQQTKIAMIEQQTQLGVLDRNAANDMIQSVVNKGYIDTGQKNAAQGLYGSALAGTSDLENAIMEAMNPGGASGRHGGGRSSFSSPGANMAAPVANVAFTPLYDQATRGRMISQAGADVTNQYRNVAQSALNQSMGTAASPFAAQAILARGAEGAGRARSGAMSKIDEDMAKAEQEHLQYKTQLAIANANNAAQMRAQQFSAQQSARAQDMAAEQAAMDQQSRARDQMAALLGLKGGWIDKQAALETETMPDYVRAALAAAQQRQAGTIGGGGGGLPPVNVGAGDGSGGTPPAGTPPGAKPVGGGIYVDWLGGYWKDGQPWIQHPLGHEGPGGSITLGRR